MNTEKIKYKIKEKIEENIKREEYENHRNICNMDDAELDIYREQINGLIKPFEENIDYINKCHVKEIKDNELKEDILKNYTKMEKCNCINIDNLELYMLYIPYIRVGDKFYEQNERARERAYIFCKECEKYFGFVYFK